VIEWLRPQGVAAGAVGEPSAADRVAASPGAVLRVAIVGLVLMASGLILVGATLTYLPMLDGMRAWDARISEELADSRTDGFESFAVFVSRLGDAPSILGLAMVITLVLAMTRKWLAMAFVPLGLLIEFACFGAVNYAVQRPRPDVPRVGSVPSTFSYPSGHVAATVVCWIGAALLLAMFGRVRPARVIAAVGALMVVFVAWARVYLGMHYALDTALGMAMGGGALLIAARALWPSAFGRADRRDPSVAAAVDEEAAPHAMRFVSTTAGNRHGHENSSGPCSRGRRPSHDRQL
jgi:membrane-associated phospholipid phosphatase